MEISQSDEQIISPFSRDYDFESWTRDLDLKIVSVLKVFRTYYLQHLQEQKQSLSSNKQTNSLAPKINLDNAIIFGINQAVLALKDYNLNTDELHQLIVKLHDKFPEQIIEWVKTQKGLPYLLDNRVKKFVDKVRIIFPDKFQSHSMD